MFVYMWLCMQEKTSNDTYIFGANALYEHFKTTSLDEMTWKCIDYQYNTFIYVSETLIFNQTTKLQILWITSIREINNRTLKKTQEERQSKGEKYYIRWVEDRFNSENIGGSLELWRPDKLGRDINYPRVMKSANLVPIKNSFTHTALWISFIMIFIPDQYKKTNLPLLILSKINYHYSMPKNIC